MFSTLINLNPFQRNQTKCNLKRIDLSKFLKYKFWEIILFDLKKYNEDPDFI